MAQIHRHVVVRRVSAADDFAGDDYLLVLALHQEIDRLAFERKQQRLGNRIGPIILFQHLNRVFAARVAQNGRVRLQVLRNARYSRSATVAREGAYQSRPRAIRRLREDSGQRKNAVAEKDVFDGLQAVKLQVYAKAG